MHKNNPEFESDTKETETPPLNLARLSEFTPGKHAESWLKSCGIQNIYIYEIPLRVKFRAITERNGLILRGNAGLAEAAPFWNYKPQMAIRWFLGAIDMACAGIPAAPKPVKLNTTVPVVSPQQAFRIVRESGCHTAKVKVADPHTDLNDDLDRLRAVRQALGNDGQIRVDANKAWTLQQAKKILPRLSAAAQGLEYAEQPCAELSDLVQLQHSTGINVAADESVRLSRDPGESLKQCLNQGLGAVVMKAMPLGGPRTAAQLCKSAGAPKQSQMVVSSALDTGIGLVAGMSLANAIEVNTACGLKTASLLSGRILKQEPYLAEGYLHAPNTLELNLDLPPASALTIRRWHQRLEEIAKNVSP